jgi:MraZ protein
VPAPFRAVLARLNAEEVVLRKSSHSPCIEVWPKPVFDAEVDRRIADLDPFDPSYEKLSRKLVARIHVLRPDAEGRMVLPKELIEKAELDGEIAYSGRIRFFQIWNAARLAEAEAADEEEEA